MPTITPGVRVHVDISAVLSDTGERPIHLDLPDDADITVDQAAHLMDGLKAATDAIARVRALALGEEPF